jgi:hypothetical protein
MNRNRKIVVVSVLALVALAVTTGWSVLAPAAWPPQPYKANSLAGLWTSTMGYDILMMFGPEDQSGVGVCEAVHLSMDPTLGGMIAGATTDTPMYFKYVRTGSDTWQLKGLVYFKDSAKPKPNVLAICVFDDTTIRMTAPGEFELIMTRSLYLGSQDKDLDGVPDPGQKPVAVLPPDTSHWKAL